MIWQANAALRPGEGAWRSGEGPALAHACCVGVAGHLDGSVLELNRKGST